MEVNGKPHQHRGPRPYGNSSAASYKPDSQSPGRGADAACQPEGGPMAMTVRECALRDAYVAKAKAPFLDLEDTDENWSAMTAAVAEARARWDRGEV